MHLHFIYNIGSVDYLISITEFFLSDISSCFKVEVVDDSIVEHTEEFSISLSSTDPLIRLNNSEATIFILDNDSKNLLAKDIITHDHISYYYFV